MKTYRMGLALCLICAAILAGCAETPEEFWVDEAPVTEAQGAETDGVAPLRQTIALYAGYCAEIQNRFPGIELGQLEAGDFEALLDEAEGEEARLELGRQLNQAIAGATQRAFLYIENQRKMGNGEMEGAQEFLDAYAEKFAEVDWTDRT